MDNEVFIIPETTGATTEEESEGEDILGNICEAIMGSCHCHPGRR